MLHESLFPEVRELELFRHVEAKNFEALVRSAYVLNFPPQSELITEGESSDFLHIVLSGSVDMFSCWNDRETSVATVYPGSTFILAATIKDGPYLMSARTLEKSRIALIPSADVRTVFNEDARFARAVVTELAQSFRTLVKSTKNLKLRTSLERLANYLLRQQERAGGHAEFELPTEKRRLASYLGMTPENLSRAFNALKPYGVAVSGNRIIISNQPDLVAFAKPNDLIDDYTT